MFFDYAWLALKCLGILFALVIIVIFFRLFDDATEIDDDIVD